MLRQLILILALIFSSSAITTPCDWSAWVDGYPYCAQACYGESIYNGLVDSTACGNPSSAMASTKKSVVKCICENAATGLSNGEADSLTDCVYSKCNGTTWNSTQWVENIYSFDMMCEYADGP